MIEKNKIAVVIPTYNAEKTIEHVVEGIPDFVDTIIIVDDASKDNTPGIISDLISTRLISIRL